LEIYRRAAVRLGDIAEERIALSGRFLPRRGVWKRWKAAL
jgi:hypothetical protein